MSESENIALINRMYDAFRRGDIATIMNHVDENVQWETEAPKSIPYSGVYHKREDVMKFFNGIGETMDEISLEMAPFAAQGDNLVTAGRYKARIKPTGRRIDVPLVHLWTIRNGLVVRYQNMSDTGAIAAAYEAGAAAGR